MPLSKDQKQAQVQDLVEKMGNSSSIIFANYNGLSVAEVSDFRNQLREQNAEMKVAKKTLAKIAAKEVGLPELEDSSMEGAVSFIFSYEDPMSGAQVTHKYSKKHKQVAIVGGLFDGKILSQEEAIELAKMPSRDVLLATFVGMIQSPLRNFASMCNSPLTSFARAVSEAAEKNVFGAETPEVKEEAKAETPTETKEEVKEDSGEAETSSETPESASAEAEAPETNDSDSSEAPEQEEGAKDES